MQQIHSHLQVFLTSRHQLSVYVPDAATVRDLYKQNNIDFPYWSQVWPAALGLCQFLEQNIAYIENKTVLELAAGLALPSFLAAHYSRSVHCSDYFPEAVALQQRSIEHNQFSNMSCSILDWNDIPAALETDVLLLSDVNYDPWLFNKVYETIERFLNKGSLIILSTPQRLMAKPFIEKLLPFCIRHEELTVNKDGKTVAITVMVLEHLKK